MQIMAPHCVVNSRSFWEMVSHIDGWKLQLPPYGKLVRPGYPPAAAAERLQRVGGIQRLRYRYPLQFVMEN